MMHINQKLVSGVTAFVLALSAPAAAFPAYAAGSAGNALEGVVSGMYLKDIYTNKSMYAPGEAVMLTVQLGGALPAGATLTVTVRHVGEVIYEETRPAGSGAESFLLSMPAKDFTGYSAEAYVKLADVVLDYTMTGIDVSSDWSRFPRYGYITKLDHRTDGEIAQNMDRMKKHHVNGLFYYDVFDSQDKPLAGSVAAPGAEWHSLAGQTVDAQSMKKTIAAGHALGINSFFYNLVFGAYDNYEERGISPEWGLYNDARHQKQDCHDLSGSNWETSGLWMFNPANTDWQKHFVDAHREFLAVYDFDGLQMDSLGSRGAPRYDYWGNALELDQTYVPFLDRLEKELGTRVIFNPVGGYGLRQVLNSGVYDVIYVEVWPGDSKDYLALKHMLDGIYQVTKGERGSILGAYMNYDVMKGEPFNLPGILYTDAMIMACGGSHLELGDTGMLSSEYYPGNSLRISAELERRLRSYYSFSVAYENLLRGTGLVETGAKTYVNGESAATDAALGKVFGFTKEKDGKTIVQLINFDGASTTAWVDSRGAQTAPKIKTDVAVRQSVSRQPSHVYVMSPDCQQGIMQEVPFTYKDGEVSFTLPYLEYWDMVVIE